MVGFELGLEVVSVRATVKFRLGLGLLLHLGLDLWEC